MCLARNCAASLPGFFSFLQKLDNDGFCCSAIVGENGSSDATRALIQQAAEAGIALLDTGCMAGAGSRMARMATGRQALLDAAETSGFDCEFVCVADLDNVMAVPPPPAAVREAIQTLRTDGTLFAVGATSRPVYYDLLSLRAEGFEFLPGLAEIVEAKKKPFRYYRFHCDRIYRNQEQVTASVPLVCASSFNGLCLYNAHDFRLGSYRAPNEAEVCEHVSFNLSLVRATGKKMLISSDLALQTPGDHARVGFFRFWSDRLLRAYRGSGKKPA
ncbi:MAG: glycosyltransferase family 2 protein [Terriglobia bacterium]